MAMMKQKIILVDMDGVLSDFEGEFLKRWRKQYPDHLHIPLKERKLHALTEEYPKELTETVRLIYREPGFFRSLPEIAGGKEALSRMEDMGHRVFICTSPVRYYENCVVEKYHWIAERFGYEWTKKIILTKDKTLVYGDFLIDDKPEHTGMIKPFWEHILYDAPYNKHIKTKRRITWANWNEILKLNNLR